MSDTKEFDPHQKTGDIVRLRVLPEVAKHGAVIKTLLGISVSLFLAGVTYANCSSKYQLASAAKERSDKDAAGYELLRHGLEVAAGHIEAHDAVLRTVLPIMQEEIKHTVDQVDKIADKVHAEKVPPPAPAKHER